MALERHGLTPRARPGRGHRRGRRRRLDRRSRSWPSAASRSSRSPAGRRRPTTSRASAPPRSSRARSWPAPGKPLAKERWAGAVDAVGSTTLANLLSMTRYGGAVAACGLAGGMDLPGSVAPFILRGVCLYGIELGDVPDRAARKRGKGWKPVWTAGNWRTMTAKSVFRGCPRPPPASSKARCAGESWSRSGKRVQDLSTNGWHS